MPHFYIESKSVRKLLVLGVVISLLGCNTVTTVVGTPAPTLPPPTPTFTPGTFEGYYLNGFEVSSFVPCDLAVTAGYGEGYWFAGNEEFFKRYEHVVEATGIQPGDQDYGIVFIRFTGAVSAPGEYGHLNGYSRAIELETLLEMEPLQGGQCVG